MSPIALSPPPAVDARGTREATRRLDEVLAERLQQLIQYIRPRLTAAPRFMEGVERVQQVDDEHLQWRVNIGGTVKELERR
jgi:hypothetical protein